MAGGGARRMGMHARHRATPAGQVLGDGPPPTRLRHRMNSAALRFAPPEWLEAEGDGRSLLLFQAHGEKAINGGAIP